MFTGTYEYTIDAKSRLFVPSRLRDELGREFMLCKGMDTCLFVFSKQSWSEFYSKIISLPMAEQRNLRRFFLSGAIEAYFDAQGRVVVPQIYKDYACLSRDVTIVGAGNYIEIWDSAKWNKQEEEMTSEAITRTMIELGF